VSAIACTDGLAPPISESARHPIDLSAEWSMAAPSAEGIDSTQLALAYAAGSTVSGLTSALVVRHGRLVAEQYFQGGRADSLYAARSVTKSVMSLLVGIAIGEGHIADVAVPLSAYFGPPLPVLDPAKGAITVGDLLTMTSGFKWDEEGNVAEYDNWVSSPDEIAYLISRPLVCQPGHCFNYNSAAVHLLSVILSRAIPIGTAAFADRVLFSPLGFHSVSWEYFLDGYANGGAGLYLRPRDMAKIGALVLQQGVSGRTSIVSSAWIRRSTSSQIATGDGLPGIGRLDYGDLWWVGTVNNHGAIVAWGYGGQFIWVVPDLDLVIVTTAAWQGLGPLASIDAHAIAGWITTRIIPTVHAH
jgi:CubicO group peptidase (beta-lactamase class C family)